MSASLDHGPTSSFSSPLLARMAELGPRFAGRASTHDADRAFVSENWDDLRAAGAFAAAVPAELGGGGATYPELCEMLRTLAHSCGSTALALSMHTHLVATMAWRWRHQKAPVEGLLRRVAGESLTLVSTGGADWLASSGRAEKVDGGFLVTARKPFASGAPGGRLLMTSCLWEDAQGGPTVIHFGIPMDAPGVRVEDTWDTLGMRGTGSHDVVLDGVFVADEAAGVRRPAGVWHPLMHIVSMVAFPLIYAVYVGVAEGARDIAVELATRKRQDPLVQLHVGELENELAAARCGLHAMIEAGSSDAPGDATTNAIFIGRTLVARGVTRAAEKALEVAGGSSFYRGLGLERAFRDVQAARFHPLQEKAQARLAGRLALGLPADV